MLTHDPKEEEEEESKEGSDDSSIREESIDRFEKRNKEE